MNRYLIIWACLLAAAPVFADEQTGQALKQVHQLACDFEYGSIANWDGRQVKVEKKRHDLSLTFESIDLAAGTAKVVTQGYRADIEVFSTPAGLFFVEKTGTGNMIMTTVFPRFKKGSRHFIAVTSAHIYLPDGPPLASQYHGVCTAAP